MPESQVLCVDIGGTSTKAGALNIDGEIEFLDSIPTKPDVSTYFNSLVQLIERTASAAFVRWGHVPNGLGVSVAGFLDEQRECLIYNPNISWLEKFPLRQRLLERLPGIAVELELDSNAATMAEFRFGSGKGSKRFLCVTAGTGLGVGMTIDGQPLRFAYGCLGDIGHLIVDRNGPLCNCGGRGCAEAIVSAPTIAERYRKAIGETQLMTLRDVISAAGQNCSVAIELLKETGEWLGLAIASMANLFFPDHIAVAGGLSAAGQYVLGPAEQTFYESASVLARSNATFARATLGATAPLIGASWPFWAN